MSFPKYPAYKDSGVEWIGEIPVGWCIAPFFSVAIENRDKNTNLKSSNTLSLSYGNIIERDKNNNFGLLPDSYENYQIVKYADIIFRLTDLQNDKNSLRSAISRYNGIITSAYLSVKIMKNYCPFYISYLMRAYDCEKVFYSMGGGVRQSLNFKEFKYLPVILPPLPEQQAIASFLDHECGKIDALIAEQERLIALLAEKRQAVISHAVTKGLNPNAPMKDSGIPWIGMVPKGWEIRPIKMIAEIFGRIGYRGYTSADIVDENIGVISLSPSNMDNGKVYFDEKNTYITKEKYEESPEIKISPNDILLVKTGSTIGKVAYVYEKNFIESTINPQIVVFKKIKIDNKFLFFVLSTNFMRSEFENGNVGGTIPTMSQAYISNLRIVIPTISEQKMISNSLSEQESKFRSEREYVLKIIALLKERRAALISAAVTGKIDVRAQSKAIAA